MSSTSELLARPSIPPAEGDFPVLARLVGDVDRFARTVWGASPLLRRPDDDGAVAPSSQREPFADVFSLRQLDEFVAMSARVPTVRMVTDGSPLPITSYCRSVRLGGRQLDDVVDGRKVVTMLGEGATLVAQSLHRMVPSVADFVSRLQREISHPVQANAYLTPPDAAGLSAHSDRHDVIAVQLSGSKHWWVDGLGDIVLRPGDTLYMPIGTRHSAATSDEMSLHLTLGIIRVTTRDVLGRVLAAGPDLDRPLPLGYRHRSSSPALATVIDDALDRALDAVGGADLDDLVEAEQHRRLDPLPVVGRIESLAHVSDVDLETMVRWVATEPRIRDADRPNATTHDISDHDHRPTETSRVIVDIGDRTLTLPSTAVPALRSLATGLATRVRDLPGLDESSRIVLARRLVREAACVVERLPTTTVG